MVAGALAVLASVVVLIAVILAPQADMARLAQLFVNGLVTGSILALAGVGATLIFGIQRIANFAHGDFLTIGAYAAFVNVVLGQNLLVAALGAMGAVALFGVAAHFGLFRPLRGRGTVAIALVSVGLGLLIRNVIFIVAGSQTRQFNVNQSEVITVGVVRLSPGQAVAVAVAVVVSPLVALFLARTRVGKQMRAVADNRDLASVSGIDVERIGVYVWILAGGLAGLAGVMLGLSQGTFDPNMGLGPLFLIFTAVVLGGIGSAYGALVAGLVLGLAMELSTWDALFGGLDSKYKPVLAFVVLILLLLYRPQGLFGQARVL
jgi:branched-subunit amino acid ABC-type transport system permease component